MEEFRSILVFCLLVLAGANFAGAVEEVKFNSSSGQEGSCSVYQGYDISPGYDLDLIRDRAPSLSKCCQRCSEREDCKGWTMYEGKCHLKASTVLDKARQPSGTVSGIIDGNGLKDGPIFSDKPPQVESPRGKEGVKTTCSVHTDFEIVGGELSNLSYMYLSECCHECGNRPQCTGWTYHEWECILKNGTELSPKTGDVSGLVLPPAVQESPGDVAPPSE